jgi:Domain of unknown function (DUF4954)
MYALARNAGKYVDRDKRTDRSQHIEYDFLAPDTVNEIFVALTLLKIITGEAYQAKIKETIPAKELLKTGESLLEMNEVYANKLELFASGFENAKRKTEIIKGEESYHIFKRLIIYYGVMQLIEFIDKHKINEWKKLYGALPFQAKRAAWINIGGQLIPELSVGTLTRNIRTGRISSWDEVHSFYRKNSIAYPEQKFQHAFASLLEILKMSPRAFSKKLFLSLLQQVTDTREWMVKSIFDSRAKDYQNDFRKMVYDNNTEMEKVIGKLDDNVFINQQKEELKQFKKQVEGLLNTFR